MKRCHFLLMSASLWAWAMPPLPAQQELRGKIVEVNGNQAVGMPGVEVGVANYDDDITDQAGAFLLHLPENWEQATITLKNSSLKIIRPALGEVGLPAPQHLEIQVCGAEKKRLLKKVESLESEVKKLRKERSLSHGQIARLHGQMLDTILHYEQVLQEKETAVATEKQSGEAKSAQITALEQHIANLERQLKDALEEKFRQQKKQFDLISATLEDYLDQVKNLRDMLLPERLSPYFLNPGARQRLYDAIEKYNAARNALLEGQTGFVTATAHYWDDPDLPDELEALCKYLLKEVHDKGVYPMEFSVMEPLRQMLGNQMTRIRAEKEATKAAEAAIPPPNDYIPKLESKTRQLLDRMQENI